MKKNLDPGSFSVIIITFLLFLIALFTKGLTHDILVEAGVLLVSVKLIIMAYRTTVFYDNILIRLKNIEDLLNKNQ